jgi:hypothetical protein
VKRKEVIERIAAEAASQGVRWAVKRSGANHDIYVLGDGKLIPIGRHRELGNGYAEMVWKQCGEVLGEGWWK